MVPLRQVGVAQKSMGLVWLARINTWRVWGRPREYEIIPGVLGICKLMSPFCWLSSESLCLHIIPQSYNYNHITVIITRPEKYCSIKTGHTGVYNMWILKNSTNLLSSLGHSGVHRPTSIQTFDFSALYTSIPHDLLKSRMNNIINNAFKHKNGATRYTHIKIGRNKSYFTSDPLNGDNKYTANNIRKN